MAPEIFDRSARRAIAARAARSRPEDRWLLDYLTDEALLRMDATGAGTGCVLITGPAGSALSAALAQQGVSRIVVQGDDSVCFDEDRPPFADRSFDTIVAAGALDTVNDLPGALLRFRQMLKPNGTFIGSMPGAGSLPALRSAMSDLAGTAHFHPQVDVRAAGDLLARAGFLVPIADFDTIEARYSGLDGLVRDLRANGLSNAMPNKSPLSRRGRANAAKAFRAASAMGKTVETFRFVHLTARAPGIPL